MSFNHGGQTVLLKGVATSMTSEEPLVAWVFLLRYSVNYSS